MEIEVSLLVGECSLQDVLFCPHKFQRPSQLQCLIFRRSDPWHLACAQQEMCGSRSFNQPGSRPQAQPHFIFRQKTLFLRGPAGWLPDHPAEASLGCGWQVCLSSGGEGVARWKTEGQHLFYQRDQHCAVAVGAGQW